jgi:hypothetical protein
VSEASLPPEGGSSTSTGARGSSSQQPPEWVLELTRRMDPLERRVAPPDPSIVSSTTTQSPQLPQSGTQPPWILDSGASFHMTHDSTHLDSLGSLHSSVLIFLLLARAPFMLPIFMCRLFLMYLSFTCNFSLLARLLIMVVVSFLILTFVLFRIVAPGLWLVLAVGSVILLVFGSFIGCIFLRLPLCAS